MDCIISNDKFNNKYRIKSARYPNFNYSSNGIYFITICTYNKNNFFGKIVDNKMELSKMGEIIRSELLKTFKIRKNIKLHESVIMPNHLHLLVEIKIVNDNVETPCMASLQIQQTSLQKDNKYKILNQKSNQLIPKTIQQFKSAITRQINPKTIFFGWQPRYFDEIIKDEKHYWVTKNYIQNNPKNWEKDDCFKI